MNLPLKIKYKKIKILIHARSKWITELIVEYIEKEQSNNFIISNDYGNREIDAYDIIIDEPSEKYSHWEHFVLSIERICVKASVNNPLVGKTLRVLCDGVSKNNAALFAGRTEGNKIAFFEGCDEDTGKFVDFWVERADAFALYGRKIEK